MARIHTHYDNLKVARNAPPEVIRAAYKTLSQKYHPDRNPGSPDAIRIIQIINLAYEVLSDPVRRREHDEWIARKESQMPEPEPVAVMTPEFVPRRSSRHGRRKRRSGFHKAAEKLASATFVQAFRTMLNNFSKHLFR